MRAGAQKGTGWWDGANVVRVYVPCVCVPPMSFTLLSPDLHSQNSRNSSSHNTTRHRSLRTSSHVAASSSATRHQSPITSLHVAASSGATDSVIALLKGKADPNAENMVGKGFSIGANRVLRLAC